jgi:ornithine cyclodeaminase
VLVLDDGKVRQLLESAAAIAAVRDSLAAQHAGRLIAPARLHADLGDGDLLFTVGRLAGTSYGFRVYDTMPTVESDQVTVVYDDVSGRLAGVVTGEFLGAARTGAIGAVAVDVLARPDAGTLALIGSGSQAWTQLWAIRAVRALREVRVYSRDVAHRETFAQRARTELGLPAVAVGDPATALAGADVVVLATSSATPVIESGWIAEAGVHVTTLGPKLTNGHECPPDLAERADVILTDSLAQLGAYRAPFFLSAVTQQRIGALSAAVAAAGPRRASPDQTTLFCSVGLAGTDVAVAAAVLCAAAGR